MGGRRERESEKRDERGVTARVLNGNKVIKRWRKKRLQFDRKESTTENEKRDEETKEKGKETGVTR